MPPKLVRTSLSATSCAYVQPAVQRMRVSYGPLSQNDFCEVLPPVATQSPQDTISEPISHVL